MKTRFSSGPAWRLLSEAGTRPDQLRPHVMSSRQQPARELPAAPAAVGFTAQLQSVTQRGIIIKGLLLPFICLAEEKPTRREAVTHTRPRTVMTSFIHWSPVMSHTTDLLSVQSFWFENGFQRISELVSEV